MSEAVPAGIEDTTEMATILIVEDERELAEEMAAAIQDYGMRGILAESWDRAMEVVALDAPELIVLDQRLGKVDAVARLGEMRRATAVPVIILTGNRAEADRIVALEVGADDFLTKPISGRELVARIRAHLRRATSSSQGEARIGWQVVHSQRALRRPDGTTIELTGAEYDLLVQLMAARGKPLDRDTLTQRVLHRSWRFGDRALDNLVLNLRKKLGPGAERAISTLRNQGYCFAGFPDA